MKVNFAASNFKLDEYAVTYKKIIQNIEKHGHELTRKWIDQDLNRQTKKQSYTSEERLAIWQDVKTAILNADAVILEASRNTFSIGYQAAFSLSNKKPTLVLTDNDTISNTIIKGEDNPLLQVSKYSEDSLDIILENFFLKFQVNKNELRFNLMLDRETQLYLDLKSYKTGKTKAKILRDMIKHEMRNSAGL